MCNEKINIIGNNSQKKLDILVQNVVKLLRMKGLKIATAESCTGGMLSQSITSVAGSSEIFELGICSYSNSIKTQELSVPFEFFSLYGAVSEQVAVAMAKGIMMKANADIGVGITGIAGPDGGTDKKPVGTVFVSVCYGEIEIVKNLKLYENYQNIDREEIRILSVISVLNILLDILERRGND